MENKDMPAFPVLELKQMGDKLLLDLMSPGVSKREYFAAAALKGLLANSTLFQGYSSYTEMAGQAIGIADALLHELSKS
jgi:hypothetical protein